jgi:hypothetical protein
MLFMLLMQSAYPGGSSWRAAVIYRAQQGQQLISGSIICLHPAQAKVLT